MPQTGSGSIVSRTSSRGSLCLSEWVDRSDTSRSVGATAAPEREREREDQSAAVRVVVRFRPPVSQDEGHEACPAFAVDSDGSSVESTDLQYRFHFDQAFDQSAAQSDVYDNVGRPVVEDVLNGYHGTILAYGQTGSGKTYCMFGPQGPHPIELQGVVPRAAQQILDFAASACIRGLDVSVECAFFEVYSEQVRDLCAPKAKNQNLQVKELPQRGFCVDGLTHKPVNSLTEVLQVLRVGLRSRAAAASRLNQHSSRSHAIFALHVKQQLSEDTERHGKLTLVDLAGSEKVQKSGSAGEMLEEAKKINSSLSALGHVIDALADKRSHVPYRDSRLTRILEDSLGGNCRTTLIVACSPSSAHSAETLSSLRFAARAKKVCNYARANVTYVQDRLLLQRIAVLRRELANAHRELDRRTVQSPSGQSPSKAAPPGSPKRQARPAQPNLQAVLRSWTEVPLAKSASASSIGSLTYRTPVQADRDADLATKSPCLCSTASTVLGSAVSTNGSAGVSLASASDAASVTPAMSDRDTPDDNTTGRRYSWLLEATSLTDNSHRFCSRSVTPPPTRNTVRQGNLEQSMESEESDHNVQDLQWRLQLEKDRCAALSSELARRERESRHLQQRLQQARSRMPSSPSSSPSRSRPMFAAPCGSVMAPVGMAGPLLAGMTPFGFGGATTTHLPQFGPPPAVNGAQQTAMGGTFCQSYPSLHAQMPQGSARRVSSLQQRRQTISCAASRTPSTSPVRLKVHQVGRLQWPIVGNHRPHSQPGRRLSTPAKPRGGSLSATVTSAPLSAAIGLPLSRAPSFTGVPDWSGVMDPTIQPPGAENAVRELRAELQRWVTSVL